MEERPPHGTCGCGHSHPRSRVQERGKGRGTCWVSLSTFYPPVSCNQRTVTWQEHLGDNVYKSRDRNQEKRVENREWMAKEERKTVDSCNNFFFFLNWWLFSRHWAKCIWFPKLNLGFVSWLVGYNFEGNLCFLEYFFYLQHFNKDSTSWIRLPMSSATFCFCLLFYIMVPFEKPLSIEQARLLIIKLRSKRHNSILEFYIREVSRLFVGF